MATDTTTAKKPTKAELIAVLVERGTHHRPALTKMTIAALEALVDEAPAAAEQSEQPAATEETPTAAAPPAKARRGKNAVVTIDGFTVKTGAWMTMHDAAGKRVAIVRRDAVPVLTQAVAEKVLRVQTAYVLDEKSVGWVRNGTSLASVAKVLKKALAEAAK